MKKSNKLLILFVALTLIVGGLFWYQRHSKIKKAAAVISAYSQIMKKADYQKLPALLSSQSVKKSAYSKKAIQQKYQAIFAAMDARDFKFSDQQYKVRNKKVEVSYQLTFQTTLGKVEKQKYQTTVSFADGKAQLDWQPSLIFPGMSKKDTVQIQTEEVERGKILDRNGNTLATSHKYQQLGINPGKLGSGSTKADNIKAISKMFAVKESTLTDSLKATWAKGDVFVPIKILYGNDEYDGKDSLPDGAVIEYQKKRYYPFKEAAAHLIGYVNPVTQADLKKDSSLSENDVIGRAGIEAAYDKKLRGKAGGSIIICDDKAKKKATILKRKQQAGQNVRLTIDAKAQYQAFEALKKTPASTVVAQPTTGQLLVATSSPSYDPNQMVIGMNQTTYDKLNNDKKTPFLRRFTNRYAPGSTFKVVTAAIGLDNGTIDPAENFEISGLKWQKDSSWGSYQVTRVKEASPINLEKALVYSDNIYFARQTLKMGEKKFKTGLNKFIFGEKLDLPLAMEDASIANQQNFRSDILLADTGYGQGELQISPIQQLSMYSVFMNDGDLIYPQLLYGQDTKTKEAVITKTSSQLILKDLIHTVADSDGYVHSLYNDDFNLAAKTGTAEIKEKQDTTGIENSFLLYFDVDNKNFMGLTMVEDSLENGTAVDHSKELTDYLEENYQ